MRCALQLSLMRMRMQHRWDDTDREKLTTAHTTRMDLKSNPCLRGERPATKGCGIVRTVKTPRGKYERKQHSEYRLPSHVTIGTIIVLSIKRNTKFITAKLVDNRTHIRGYQLQDGVRHHRERNWIQKSKRLLIIQSTHMPIQSWNCCNWRRGTMISHYDKCQLSHSAQTGYQLQLQHQSKRGSRG
jgi:hypothetical protein